MRKSSRAWFAAVSAVVGVVGLAGVSCINTQPCLQPPHPALTAQPMGDPCTASTDCGNGLTCLRTSDGLDEEPAWGGLRSCSQDCTTTSCPVGAACVTKRVLEDGGSTRFCVPTCGQDADCQTSFTAAGTCSDAGVTGFCERIFCSGDAQCPAGFGCENSINVCCAPGSLCIRGGLQVGYCRRK